MRGPRLDLKPKILDRIAERPGLVWTPVDFLDLGARAAVDKALQRLAADGFLRRLDRGLYDRPSLNSLTKKLAPPSTSAIIDAVARRDQARLLVDGMTAANDLGLTTAVPAQITVLTDARLKTLTLGAQQIQFRQAAPSRLFWAGRPAMRVVQALYWLQDVLPSDRDAIARRLGQVIADPEHGASIAADLRQGLSALPIWMHPIVRDLLASADHHQQQGAVTPDTDGDDAGAGADAGAGEHHGVHRHEGGDADAVGDHPGGDDHRPGEAR